mgnify:CR=1 FL=1
MANKSDKHEQKMKNLKSKVDLKIAAATEERGEIIVITGNGKGKSSSAFGTALRSLGHGYKVGIAQFIKGAQSTGEQMFLEKLPDVEYHAMCTGFTWETQDKDKDTEATLELWQEAENMLANPDLHLVVLDEITYVVSFGYLELQKLVDALKARPVEQTVIITGRGAGSTLKEMADTVSEVKEVKHAFQQGLKARKGVEY